MSSSPTVVVDAVLQRALLLDGRTVDVHIAAGRIVAVIETGTPLPDGATIHDLAHRLLLPAMAEPHAHLDKALLAATTRNDTGDLAGAMQALGSALDAGQFAHDALVERATAAVEMLIRHGVTAVRSHVNVGEGIGARFVAAIAEVRSAFRDLIDVEIVALTHTPLTGSAGSGNRAALAQAFGAGADLVGGCPHLDPNGIEFIETVLAAATEAGIGLDLHMDETLDPRASTLRELARMVTESGFTHGVTASHCVSLGMQTPDVQRSTAIAVAAARIAVVALPPTNLYLQGRDHFGAIPRGLAPIELLRSQGVLVAAGGDNVQDPFNPLGRGDPLETAALLVLAGHQQPETAYAMVSNDAREVMGLRRIEMRPGDPADFVAVRAASEREVIADATSDRLVFHDGRLVASTTSQTTIHRTSRV